MDPMEHNPYALPQMQAIVNSGSKRPGRTSSLHSERGTHRTPIPRVIRPIHKLAFEEGSF